MAGAYKPRRRRFLEDGPHTVEVTPMTVEDGPTGRRYVPGTPVVVGKVFVQPSSGSALRASETRTVEKGLFDETVRVVYGRGYWPGGPHSKVRVIKGPEGAEGITYQQAGSAVHYGASPMTAHFKVRIDATGVESK
jgi:hypothetical protein|nr:MAG TPA: hypothetical protein [Caudoviricetes sp.]